MRCPDCSDTMPSPLTQRRVMWILTTPVFDGSLTLDLYC